MSAGHEEIRVERGSGRFSLGSELRIGRLLAICLVLSAMAVAPHVSRADFICDSGLSIAGLQGHANGLDGEASQLGVVWEALGSSSSAGDERESAPQDAPRQENREPASPYGLADVDGGCSSTSSPTSDGGNAGSVGMMNEGQAAAGVNCSGRVATCAALRLPSPLLARLLDPPRNAA